MFFLYKIFYNSLLLYVGSTNNIQRRKREHKKSLNNGFDRPLYNYLRNNNIKFEQLIFEIIETDIDNKCDLLLAEGAMIKELLPVCNERIEGRTNKEWRNDNIEKIKENKRQYREKNIEKIKEYKKQYYEQNIEKIKEKSKIYRENNSEKYKEYRENNLEKERERCRKKSLIYRQNNLEKIKQYYNENRDLINKKQREAYHKKKQTTNKNLKESG